MIAFAAKADLQPPVAILVHAVDTPKDAVYYPFAEFSPEWQAIKWALSAGVPVRFMDLPQWHRIPIEAARVKAIAEAMVAKADEVKEGERSPVVEPEEKAATQSPDRDPLDQLAKAAGFDDGERWWEHVVEHNRTGDLGIFAAIKDAMAELRQGRATPAPPRDADEPLREAWMRRTIREAKKESFENIAVVCGAWHAPALDVDATSKKDDDQLLARLPKVKTAATWVPWTYDRLTFASGYGAGVHSPGWYEHLWKREQHIIEAWMTRTATLLRSHDIDCSSAHVIEAVRLSDTLATMRGPAAGGPVGHRRCDPCHLLLRQRFADAADRPRAARRPSPRRASR